MPCILKVHVGEARGLPAMDRTSEVADAYVEISFGDAEVQKTSVCRKTLNPVWREDFRLEVTDEITLQDEPLELKVFDFDAITADDSVGTITLDLNPLLSPDAPNALAGWFPIYDTIRGTRGELWIQAKLEFFENTNPFKESSAGIHFFSNAGIPVPYSSATIVGLVDFVITEVDPDYHWTDSFRTFRSSNEASQRILHQMSGRLRRQMGRKALEMGGNAILAYSQTIDIEAYSQTITVRGLGTAAVLHCRETDDGSSKSSDEGALHNNRPSENLLRIISKGIELSTISKVPSGCISAIGGVVSVKSVKLLSEEAEYGSALTRDRWLSELREEVRSHAHNLGCNTVLGYRESVSIHEDLYVWTAEGTACRIRRPGRTGKRLVVVELNDASSAEESIGSPLPLTRIRQRPARRRLRECSSCHLPKRRLQKITTSFDPTSTLPEECNICGKGLVNEMLLATIESTSDMETLGAPLLIESYVCRPLKRKKESDSGAATVSANLPFVEYDLYRQLQFKLRFHGFNAVFGLRYQTLATDKLIVSVASGTGICLAALPAAKALQISRNIDICDAEDEEIYDFQKRVAQTSQAKHSAIQELYMQRFPSMSSSSSSSSTAAAGSSSTSSNSDSTSSSSSDDGTSSGDSSSSLRVSLSDQEGQSIVQIDDEADEDLLLTLDDFHLGERQFSLLLAGNLDGQPPVDGLLSPGTTLHAVSTFVCQFRRFAVSLDEHHPNSLLASHFAQQYQEIGAQIYGGLFADQPVIHCVRHQLNLVRNIELQIVTTATVFGKVTIPVTSAKDLLLPPPSSDSIDDSSSENDDLNDFDYSGGERKARPPPIRDLMMIPLAYPSVVFSTGSLVPSSVFSTNCGTVTLQLFKEIPYQECSGGFSGFVASTISDLFAVTRASAAALGGNAVVSLAFKPAAFYENFKNQLHVVVSLAADIIKVDLDRADAWLLLQSIPSNRI